jgi:uncharacterized protein (DUF58 family)
MKALRRFKAKESLVVMPRTYPVAPLTLPGNRRLQPGGIAFAGTRGRRRGIREPARLSPGDTPRRIHWKAWARTGRLVIKEYQDEFFVRHALLLDTFPSADTLAFESAVSLAASLVMMPRRQREPPRPHVRREPHVHVHAGPGLGAPAELLRVLATVEPSRGKFSDSRKRPMLGVNRMSGGIASCCVGRGEARPRCEPALPRDPVARLGRGRLRCEARSRTDGLRRRNFRVVKSADLERELARP